MRYQKLRHARNSAPAGPVRRFVAAYTTTITAITALISVTGLTLTTCAAIRNWNSHTIAAIQGETGGDAWLQVGFMNSGGGGSIVRSVKASTVPNVLTIGPLSVHTDDQASRFLKPHDVSTMRLQTPFITAKQTACSSEEFWARSEIATARCVIDGVAVESNGSRTALHDEVPLIELKEWIEKRCGEGCIKACK